MMASRYAHAEQFKRHHRQLRLLRSRLGRIIRDIRRKITGRPELEAVFEAPMARAAQIRSQQQPAWMEALVYCNVAVRKTAPCLRRAVRGRNCGSLRILDAPDLLAGGGCRDSEMQKPARPVTSPRLRSGQSHVMKSTSFSCLSCHRGKQSV